MVDFTALISNVSAYSWPVIETIFNSLVDQQFLKYVPKVVAAMIMGGMLGFERQTKHKNAGVRTMMVLAGAAALMCCVGSIATEQAGVGDPTRIAAQLLASIGFIGAGVILKRGVATLGVTTAATIVLTVGVGMACGFGYYSLALATTLMMLASLVLTGRYIHHNERCNSISVTCLSAHEAEVRQLFGTRALLLGFTRIDDKVEMCLQPELSVIEYEALMQRLISNPHLIKVHAEDEHK